MNKKLYKVFNENKNLFLVVFLLHALVLSWHLDLRLKDSNKVAKQSTAIKLRLKPATSKPKIKRQIVTTEESDKKIKETDEKRFLSKKNQIVDRQTTAKSIGRFKKAGRGAKNGRPTPMAKQKKKTEKKALKHKIAKSIKKKKAKKSSKRKVKKLDLADLSFLGAAPTPKKAIKPAGLASKGLKSGAKDKTGEAMNNDYIEDIPLGDFTRLNTAEFKYYGFYFRIKQKLEQYWGDSLRRQAEALWRGGKRMPASSERITSVRVKIDPRGNIIDVSIKGTSGVSELDEAAVESFNRAGPFPNPPSGMIQNGYAFIEWGFVVKS